MTEQTIISSTNHDSVSNNHRAEHTSLLVQTGTHFPVKGLRVELLHAVQSPWSVVAPDGIQRILVHSHSQTTSGEHGGHTRGPFLQQNVNNRTESH